MGASYGCGDREGHSDRTYCDRRDKPAPLTSLEISTRETDSEDDPITQVAQSTPTPDVTVQDEDRQIAEMVTEELCSRGKHYYHGLAGVSVDFKEAFSLFRAAAARGSAQAEDMLGNCYYYGDGVDKNPEKAAEHYMNSAVQGYRGGMTHLAMLYEEGIGLRKDLKEALKWYQLAAEKQDKQAEAKVRQLLPTIQAQDYYLEGKNYYYGLNSCPLNLQEAVRLFRLAARLGSPEAEHKLAMCYYLGRGVSQDYQKAVKHFRLAAEQGLGCAMYQLGQCYEYGQGVEKDWIGKLRWYSGAAEKGHKKALEKMSQLTPRKDGQGTFSATASMS